MKTLIAYYSRRGQNLVNGTVKSLRVGNTELAAAMIQKYTGAVCFRIEPYEDYLNDYYQCVDLARQDLRQGKRPKLKNCPECLDQYNMIYLGYPNYWGTMPAAVFSFLEKFDFSGMVIRPFGTYEYGGMGHSVADIKRLCPKARIIEGLFIRSSDLKNEFSMIEKWIYAE